MAFSLKVYRPGGRLAYAASERGLRAETSDKIPAMGEAAPGWWSAQWTLKPLEGNYQIVNRYTKVYLHTEGGPLVTGALGAPGWWSAQWKIDAGMSEASKPMLLSASKEAVQVRNTTSQLAKTCVWTFESESSIRRYFDKVRVDAMIINPRAIDIGIRVAKENGRLATRNDPAFQAVYGEALPVDPVSASEVIAKPFEEMGVSIVGWWKTATKGPSSRALNPGESYLSVFNQAGFVTDVRCSFTYDSKQESASQKISAGYTSQFYIPKGATKVSLVVNGVATVGKLDMNLNWPTSPGTKQCYKCWGTIFKTAWGAVDCQ